MSVEPRLYVVSAPSGAGKSTLTTAVVSKSKHVRLAISSTTRPIRGDEKDGREYVFLTEAAFFEKKNNGDFLEWAQVHGYYYGTSKQMVDDFLHEGVSVLFDIDVQGAEKLKQVYENAELIFILPPSRSELERRLRERKTDNPVEIEKRLKNAFGELIGATDYTYKIVNDDLNSATAELEAIISGNPPSQDDRNAFLKRLLDEFKDHGQKSE